MELINKNRQKRKKLFSLFVSFLLISFLGLLGFFILKSLWLGTWTGEAQTCRTSGGFCFSFLREKWRYILFGSYPDSLLWRPILFIFSVILGIFFSFFRFFWKKALIFYYWIFLVLFSPLFLWGIGGEKVEISLWGGLPLTLFLSFVGIGLSYPLGIFLALMRRDGPFLLKYSSIFLIELVRGVPLISLLFMASVMAPFFFPTGMEINKTLRALGAIVIFSAAYMAEVIRGGLNAVTQGQREAAHSLGFGYWKMNFLIVLPQALKIVIPPTVNTAISLFKDTSLVIIIALLDLMSTAKLAVSDPLWLGMSFESYVFVALIYFAFSFSFSQLSKKVERSLS